MNVLDSVPRASNWNALPVSGKAAIDGPPPANVDSLLWKFSSSEEREALVASGEGRPTTASISRDDAERGSRTGPETDILVVGRRVQQDGSATSWYRQGGSWYQVSVSRSGAVSRQESPTPPPADVTNPTGPNPPVTVAVKISPPTSMEAALKAADNLAKAVEKFAEALRSVPDPNSLINVNNSATTPSIELSKLTSTDFVVVDKVPDNGGVGAAVRGGSANGRNLVSFHWDAIDGSGGDYASPNYTNQQGMMAMIGHELGHLSNEGERFHNDSHAFFDREVAEGLVRNGTYNSTEYWRNTEAWAHSFSTSLAAGVGIDISGWRPNEGTFWQSPREIYLERTRPKR